MITAQKCLLLSHLQNSWTAICFSTLAHFLAEISAHSTTMHFIPAKKWPQIGFADYPPRVLQVALLIKIKLLWDWVSGRWVDNYFLSTLIVKVTGFREGCQFFSCNENLLELAPEWRLIQFSVKMRSLRLYSAFNSAFTKKSAWFKHLCKMKLLLLARPSRSGRTCCLYTSLWYYFKCKWLSIR